MLVVVAGAGGWYWPFGDVVGGALVAAINELITLYTSKYIDSAAADIVMCNFRIAVTVSH